MVVITSMYNVVGMICGHLIFQKHWNLAAPSTSAASTRDWSTLFSADTYSTMGCPTEVVRRISMIHQMAYFSFPSQLIFFSRSPVLVPR